MLPRADMQDFTGFAPQVGEIRALRTFRIGAGGRLFPLFDDRAWSEVMNTARCTVIIAGTASLRHLVPDPECTCGFYAYGTQEAALDYPQARDVLAVVSCWGKVIAGTRGIRAEHALLEAIWMSDRVPADLVADVVTRYSGAAVYSRKDRMLARHPPTAIDSYEPQAAPPPRRPSIASLLAIVAALLIGVSPPGWSGDTPWVITMGAAQLCLFLWAAMISRGRPTNAGSARRGVLIGAATIWILAPIAGLACSLLIRVPMIEVAALLAVHQHLRRTEARQFPASIGQRGRSGPSTG